MIAACQSAVPVMMPILFMVHPEAAPDAAGSIIAAGKHGGRGMVLQAHGFSGTVYGLS